MSYTDDTINVGDKVFCNDEEFENELGIVVLIKEDFNIPYPYNVFVFEYDRICLFSREEIKAVTEDYYKGDTKKK